MCSVGTGPPVPGERRAQRLEVIPARSPSRFVVPPAASGRPAYEGHKDIDYLCGACGSLLAAGVGRGAFADIAFQCRCGALNLVPSPGE